MKIQYTVTGHYDGANGKHYKPGDVVSQKEMLDANWEVKTAGINWPVAILWFSAVLFAIGCIVDYFNLLG